MVEQAEAAKVPVAQSVAFSYGFLARHWAELAPACLLMGVYGGAAALALPDAGATTFLLMLLSIVTGAVYSAAVLRKAIHDEKSGPFGVALGADEMRLILVGVVVGLTVAPVLLVAFAGLGFVAAVEGGDEAFRAMLADPQVFASTVMDRLGPTGSAGFMLFLLLCMAALVFIWVRLFLAQAATIGERTPVVYATWAWTKGDFWRVLTAILMTSVPGFVVSGILGSTLQGLPQGAPAVAGGVAEGFMSGLLGIPSLALAAYLYKGLRPPGFKAAPNPSA